MILIATDADQKDEQNADLFADANHGEDSLILACKNFEKLMISC